MTKETVEITRLHFYDIFSDKVYNVTLKPIEDDKYVVIFAYGRRGSTLIEGTKTPIPVSFEKASSIYGKLINDKVKKGYKKV
jgi:bifunctional non-homologous end joining protein LigD